MTETSDLLKRWKALASRYPVWRMPFDLVLDPASYRVFGSDITSAMMTNRKAQRVSRILEGASAETLDALQTIADVNISRTGEFLRAVLLVYISLPLGFAAMLSDAAPETLRSMLERQSGSLVIFLIGAVVFPIAFFCGAWRAKQIGWMVQLFRAGSIPPSRSTD